VIRANRATADAISADVTPTSTTAEFPHHGAGGRGELPSSRGGRCFFFSWERGEEGGGGDAGGGHTSIMSLSSMTALPTPPSLIPAAPPPPRGVFRGYSRDLATMPLVPFDSL
jgi:hypothetical protein